MPKKVLTAWEIAKPLLEADYLSGEIDDNWPRGKVHKKRPEYERVDINNFRNNWNRMKKSIGGLKQLAARDLRILHSDKLLYPTDPNRWDGSLAQALLKQDIRDDFHEWFSSKDLYLSRIEYKQFYFERIFCPHYHQEIRSKKETNYWLVKKKLTEESKKKYAKSDPNEANFNLRFLK